MEKQGDPTTIQRGETRLRDLGHWAVHLRLGQVTLGSMVLVAKDPASTVASLPLEAFCELKQVVGEVEATLASLFSCDRINYLALMMVDPRVHLHVIPRYAAPRAFGGATFLDPTWPGPPEMMSAHPVSEARFQELRAHLRSHWRVLGPEPDPTREGPAPVPPAFPV